MNHSSLIWIFNASLILIVPCPFVDSNPYISCKCGVSAQYAKTILSYKEKFQTELVRNGLLAVKGFFNFGEKY